MVRKKIVKQVKSQAEQILEVLEGIEKGLADFERENTQSHEQIKKSLK